jgi:hypothetical protein
MRRRSSHREGLRSHHNSLSGVTGRSRMRFQIDIRNTNRSRSEGKLKRSAVTNFEVVGTPTADVQLPNTYRCSQPAVGMI